MPCDVDGPVPRCFGDTTVNRLEKLKSNGFEKAPEMFQKSGAELPSGYWGQKTLGLGRPQVTLGAASGEAKLA